MNTRIHPHLCETRNRQWIKRPCPVPVTSSSPDPRWRSRVHQAKSTTSNGGGGDAGDSRTGFRGGGTTVAVADTAYNFSSFCEPKNRSCETARPRLPYLRKLRQTFALWISLIYARCSEYRLFPFKYSFFGSIHCIEKIFGIINKFIIIRTSYESLRGLLDISETIKDVS